ncbi:ATPase [Corchorus capsularis]|uniref:ATPase n=1 Tax=Corchorus capsularis TaxID=210143 RepID=A0A1R3GV24_COCAP|nr:ATPase [Corchorus capsularis]
MGSLKETRIDAVNRQMASEETQALNKASLSKTLKSFLNQTIEMPFPFLFTFFDAYLSKVLSAMLSISWDSNPGTWYTTVEEETDLEVEEFIII